MTEGQFRIDREHAALIVVDVQPDFLPGGALAIKDSDEVLRPIAEVMREAPFGLCAATQDWHPAGHISFASTHSGKKPFDVIELHGHDQVLWPDHCVQNSAGAELHRDLPWEFASVVVRKGANPNMDSYSGLRDNWNAAGERPPTGLAGYLKERGITDVFLCGLARDICVKWTAEDAVDAGFETFLLWDLTRPVDIDSDDKVRGELEDRGVTVIDSDSLT